MRRRSEGERGAALGAEGSGAQTVGALRSLWAGRPEGERGETSLLGNGGQSRHRTAGLEGAFRSVSSQPSAIGGDTARQSSARRPTRPERFQGGGTAAALSGEWQSGRKAPTRCLVLPGGLQVLPCAPSRAPALHSLCPFPVFVPCIPAPCPCRVLLPCARRAVPNMALPNAFHRSHTSTSHTAVPMESLKKPHLNTSPQSAAPVWAVSSTLCCAAPELNAFPLQLCWWGFYSAFGLCCS